MKKIFLLLILFSLVFFSFAQKKDSVVSKKRPTIGLVLSGGGAKGFAHVGVLKIIDELGIPIDYISGTSMGSIIGGFYALGYSALDIEKVILSQNWAQILSDKVIRTYVPVYEKEAQERYTLSFPIRPSGIELPDGIVVGQNIINLFENLSVDFHNDIDFNTLPIPFLCVATDLEKGKEIILDKGFFPMALRASMSIPTFLSPVEIKDNLLVDGGVINNFPVNELKKRGIDIIIGVDVQASVKTKDELKSIVDVLNQSVSFLAQGEFEKNIGQCDIYIKPDIRKYSVGSFTDADSLIQKGEQQARKFIPILNKLKEKYNLEPNIIKRYNIPNDSTKYFISDLYIKGLKSVSRSLVVGKLGLHLPSYVYLNDIKRGIKRIYGSQFFDMVDFRLVGSEVKQLEINVKERTVNRFNVGLHYDTDNSASLLLNATFRNKLKDGSRLSFDVKLADDPMYSLVYNIDNGLKPGLQFKTDFEKSKIFMYEDGQKINNLKLNRLALDLSTHSTFKEVISLGLGVRFEDFKIRTEYAETSLTMPKDFDKATYLSYYTFIRMDTQDKAYYPKKGVNLYGEYRIVTANGLKLNNNNKPIALINFKVKKAIEINDKLTLYPKFFGRIIWGDDTPNLFMSYTGGLDQTKTFSIQVPFIGLQRMELASVNSVVLRADIQYEMFKNNFIILKTNVGRIFNGPRDVLYVKEWIRGGGITYSYNSFLGPLDFSLMYSDSHKKVIPYVNIGFWF